MRKSEKDFERKPKSRLERVAEAASSNKKKTGVASIAGTRVTETEDQRNNNSKATVSTNFRLPRDVKEQCMALAALKQVSLTELVVHAMKMQLKRNAPLLNQFTQFRIDPDSIKEDL